MFERAWRTGLVSLSMMAAAAACSGSSDPPSPASNAADTGSTITDLSVTFSGDACAYDGPSTVPAGDVNIRVSNGTDEILYGALLSIGEGHTFVDLEAWVASPQGKEAPPWVSTLVDGEHRDWGGSELSTTVTAGTYGIVCATPHDPSGSIWMAGPVSVSDE